MVISKVMSKIWWGDKDRMKNHLNPYSLKLTPLNSQRLRIDLDSWKPLICLGTGIINMTQIRRVSKVWKSQPTIEGAGVHLKRAFGFHQVPELDPFLLLDDFHSENPDDYMAGFPWHPHRGIETVTYMIKGKMRHGDSMGNNGVIESGEIQWMSAGSGIVHSEMPEQDEGLLWGFQLWVNLPSSKKMMEPRYQDIKTDEIPELVLDNGTKVKVLCGEVRDLKGPVKDIVVDPEYIDVTIPPGAEFEHPVKMGYTVLAYVLEGRGSFGGKETIGVENLVVFSDGDKVVVSSGDEHVRFILVSGKPIGEPVAWRGPIVMNTQEELQIAFREYNEGTFIKKK